MNTKLFKKVVEIIGIFAQLSVGILALSGFVSIHMQDWRYISVGLFLFGSLYFGGMSFPFLHRRKDIHDVIFGILFALMGIYIQGGGVALFLHHYEIDFLYHWYGKLYQLIHSIIH